MQPLTELEELKKRVDELEKKYTKLLEQIAFYFIGGKPR